MNGEFPEKTVEQQMAWLLLSQSDHIAVYKDTGLRYRYVNSAYLALLGLSSKDDVLGLTDRELFAGKASPAEIEHYINNDCKALQLNEGEQYSVIETMEDSGGKGGKRYFQTKKFPLFLDGKPAGVGTITTEITAEHRARQAADHLNAMLQTIIDNLPGTFNLVDKDLNVLYYGGKGVERTDASAEQVIGRKCYRVYHRRENPCPWCKIQQVLHTGAPYEELTEADDPRTKLTGKFLHVHIAPVYDTAGRLIGAMEYGVDVSEVRRLQQQAEQQNMVKEEFLARFTHDLRGPLAVIVELLKVLREEPEFEARDRYLQRTITASGSLISMMDEMIDYYKFQQQNTDPVRNKHYSFLQVVEEIQALFGYSMEQQGIRFDFSWDPALPAQWSGEPVLIRRVLLNLFSNSIAALQGVTAGRISLSVTGDNGAIIIELSDNGPGIPEALLDKIFVPYYSSGKSRGSTGLGLGLAQVRELVTALQGTVEARNRGGAVFTVRLPAEVAGAAESGIPDN